MNKLNELISKCKCSVSVEIDDHKDVYETVEDNILPYDLDSDDLNPDIYKEMKARDTIVRIQFYPDTPIGFYVIYHYDLDLALTEALECFE